MKPRSSSIFRAAVVLFALTAFATITISERASAELLAFAGSEPLVTRTWDGGGATNNWSDAANWTGDVVPGVGDDVIFDATSSKNATIDGNFSIANLQINSGYTGTISQGSSAVSLSGVYAQAAGTFDGGFGVLNLSSNFTVSNGSFIPSSGTIAFVGVGPQSFIIPSGFALNNLTVNKPNNSILTMINGFVVPINGTLSLIDGQVHRNSFDGLDARGDVVIAPTFDGTVLGNPPAFLNITGTATRTVTLPVGAKMLPLMVNAPNVNLNASGSGTFTFDHPVNVQNAAGFTNGDVNFFFANSLMTNGFTQGSGSLTFNSGFTQTGGTFTLGSGALTFNSAFILNAGTFNAPSGTLAFPGLVVISPGAIFNHNNGTILFNGSEHQSLSTPPGLTLNNVTVDKADNKSLAVQTSNTITILGALNLTDGGVDLNIGGTKLDAQGDVFMSPTFDGSPLNQPMNLQISGTATRTVSFPVGAQMLPLIVNAPNVTVTNSGVGTFTYRSIDLQSAAGFTNADVDLIVNGAFTLGAATVTQGSGDINFLSGGYLQNAGAFVPGSGALSFGSSFRLFGGTFTAPTSTVPFPHEFFVEPAATFNPNGGTVLFNGVGAFQHFRVPTPTFTLHNVIVNRQDNTDLGFFNSPSTLVTTGTLQLLDGRLQLNSIANVDAQGDVIVGPNFDGGQITNFRFTGPANQTYTNNGGLNVPATWRINKPTTAIVTAATSLALTAGQQLFIDSGILYLNENSNLTTSNLLTIASAGKLINDSATTITLGGNLSSSGSIELNGSGAACPGNDTVLVRSTDATQRTWVGGVNRLIDVDVQNMGGTGIKRVFSGTDSGGNSANWVFEGGCPSDVSITPGAAGVPLGSPQLFTASGGVAPYSFSLPVNNSGGTIGSTNGIYVAGNILGAVDTVRVTDAFGSTADATVNVVGPAVKFGFIVQPSNTEPGQPITPAVKVAAQDANGNTVTTFIPTVTISIANNPSGGTLSGTVTRLGSSGVATFDDLAINAIGTDYTLRASGSALTPATSNSFNISPLIGAPVKLGFIVQPTNTIQNTGLPMTPAVQVAVQDANGNTVPTAAATVTLGPPVMNPTGLVLNGTLTAQTVNGVAAFDQLFVSNPGEGHTLVATATLLVSATSNPFEIFPESRVINTNDNGPGSLRQAIVNANNRPGEDTITFDVPGPLPVTIIPLTPLPTVASQTVIDGTSQPGYAGSPVVQISGTGVVYPSFPTILQITSDSTIRGLAFNNFTPDSSGNNRTIVLKINGDRNSVKGCLFGTDITGMVPAPNFQSLQVLGSDNVIGGISPAERNVLSGSARGLTIANSTNTVRGNFIGTNMNGDAAIPNGVGIYLAGEQNTVRDNVISGNTGPGIQLVITAGDENLVQENLIGLNASATGTIPNGGAGIEVASMNNRLTRNRIFGNTGLGIKLNYPGGGNVPLLNDPLDPDPGPNKRQNHPVINLALADPGTVVRAALNSTPSSDFTLEYFSSPSCGDSNGARVGETYLGSKVVTTDAGGLVEATFVTPTVVPRGRFITATATDSFGNTSEFSPCFQVVTYYRISGRLLASNGSPLAGKQVLIRHQLPTGASVGMTHVTDSNGGYLSLFIQEGSNVTVTPRLAGATVSPQSRTYANIAAHQVNQDFIASFDGFTLRGRTRTTATASTPSREGIESVMLPPVPAGGFPLLGVTFNIVGPGINRNVRNDTFGNYIFDSLPPATYVVTPTKPNYVFNPPVANITIGGDATVDFEGASMGLSTLSGRIVYDSQGGIKAMNADGSGLVTVTPNSTRIATRIMPRWSENGQRMVLVSRSVTNAENKVLTTAADGTAREFLFTENSRLFSPVHSPDGTRIAFHNDRNDLMVMNVDGTNPQSITINCREPDWSPDGMKVVCIEPNGTTTERVITVNLATGSRTSIENAGGRKFSPRWSPDGTRIAYIRRQSGTPATHSIVVVDLLGSSNTLMSGANNLNQTLSWSPDSTRLLFIRDSIAAAGDGNAMPPGGNNQLVTIQASDGQNMLVIVDNDFEGERVDWGTSNSVATPESTTPTVVTSGAVSITFPSTTGTNAFTTITPIEPNSAGTAPNGFVIGNFAFEINTTAGFTPPITICIDLDDPGTQFGHSLVSGPPALMHNENGMLVNITTSYDPQTKILCGQTNSFSPFVVAEQIDTALPSITGLVIDSNGDPMSGVLVSLTGAETHQTQTDSNGLFTFVNLINGANYNVQPQEIGYLFSEYSQDLLAVTGENTLVFTGTPGSRQIAGRVADSLDAGVAGVTISLDGSTTGEAVTDADGNYLFTNLPVDGAYFVAPSRTGLSFTPNEQIISPLISDVSEVNFTAFAPTASAVSVGGRVLNSSGFGIGNARLTISDSQGNIMTALTNPFGYYRFDDIQVGGVYVITVEAKRYQFENPTRTVNVVDELTDVNFVALPESLGGG